MMSDPSPCCVFVYGTLMRGYANHAAVLASFVSRVECATLCESARLWHWPARGYPALELSSGSSSAVRGELVWVHDADAVRALSSLDALEDCFGPGDARNEYDRVIVRACTDGAASAAAPVRAWAYVARGLRPHPSEAAPVLVVGGCWRSYLISGGLSDAADPRFAVAAPPP